MTENKHKCKDGRDLHIFVLFYLLKSNKIHKKEESK